MSEATIGSSELITVNNRQRVFVRYLTAILIDLAVLNLFEEHWSLVVIHSFTISLFAAVLLQVLLNSQCTSSIAFPRTARTGQEHLQRFNVTFGFGWYCLDPNSSISER